MDFRTISSVWYEAIMVGGYGCKLDGTYENKREAQKAIKESKQRVKERGFEPDEYFVVQVNCIRMIDDKGDVVSETITRVRV